MSPDTIEKPAVTRVLRPLSLKDAPSFIEVQFPVGRLSAEAYKEREAKQAQTLTALGAYWKGRKPLILCRAVVLGSLLPATDDPAKDLHIFLKLMGMDDTAFLRRGLVPKPSEIVARLMPMGGILPFDATRLFVIKRRIIEDAKRVWIEEPFDLGAFENLVEHRSTYLEWADEIGDDERNDWRLRALETYTYDERVKRAKRPEECEDTLLDGIWTDVNAHLGTRVFNLPDLIEQLGSARFGHRPKVADTFCGGGSIPYEAARIGCDVYASDLNPIACMLTWGAFNIVGADEQIRAEIEAAQEQAAEIVKAEIARLRIEQDTGGNQAKIHLYCMETRCPKTGWMVPMSPSWIISKDWNVIARLAPDHARKRYNIEIHSGVSAAEMKGAEDGTVQGGRLVHPMNPERSGVEIKTIRGDYRDADRANHNRLRRWNKLDVIPQDGDIFQERLYCIQWITKSTIGKRRQETFFAAVTEHDLESERKVVAIVGDNLDAWQREGLVPNMPIEPGKKTDEPIRTRGWTYWHHLFTARQLIFFAMLRNSYPKDMQTIACVDLCRMIDRSTRIAKWSNSNGSGGQPTNVFDNQALNTQWNFGAYASDNLLNLMVRTRNRRVNGAAEIWNGPATEAQHDSDLVITDPPYADAINYHEITEFFIAWLRKNPPPPFDSWTWDSRRDLAIKGKDEDFRRDMVAAYSTITRQMPDDGLQVVMFTHQDAGVWADLGGILWASGLRVQAAWNVVTETEKPSGEGNYVQGTVCLVLRKRLCTANARRMEIEAEIEDAVRAQLHRLWALDAAWRAETLYPTSARFPAVSTPGSRL